jgi:hypothetical protein
MRASLLLAVPLLFLGFAPLAASPTDPAPDTSTARAERPASGPDFLFGVPKVLLGLRGGVFLAGAGSDVYDFMQEQMTLDDGDFRAVSLAGELAWPIDERAEGVLSIGYVRSSARSELREWVRQDDSPIEQDTDVTRVPITASLRYHAFEAGRSIGSLAWIPTRTVNPFIGAGAGVSYYRLEQVGEFVDALDESIYQDHVEWTGWAPTLHVMAGLDASVGTRTLVTTELRYTRGSGQPGSEDDFAGFEDIDLSGLEASLGLRWRI